jgi:hypothetical protein
MPPKKQVKDTKYNAYCLCCKKKNMPMANADVSADGRRVMGKCEKCNCGMSLFIKKA